MSLRRLWFSFAPLAWGRKPMPANRCTSCALNYPVSPSWAQCPICRSKTRYKTNETSMPAEELEEIKRLHKPQTAADVKKRVIEADHRFHSLGTFAEDEAAKRNRACGSRRWTAEDILLEQAEQQDREAA